VTKRCDCLNDCGDDPWLKDGRAEYCDHWKKRKAEEEARERRADLLQRDASNWRTFIGVDPGAAGGDKTVLVVNARRFGKSEEHRRQMADFLAANPDAVIFHFGKDGPRVEKPVAGEVVEPKETH
jgi:hypothetical protein